MRWSWRPDQPSLVGELGGARGVAAAKSSEQRELAVGARGVQPCAPGVEVGAAEVLQWDARVVELARVDPQEDRQRAGDEAQAAQVAVAHARLEGARVRTVHERGAVAPDQIHAVVGKHEHGLDLARGGRAPWLDDEREQPVGRRGRVHRSSQRVKALASLVVTASGW